MPTTKYWFRHQFHPVGQGLFATGSLHGEEHSAPQFTWAYDCGTTSKRALVRQAIKKLDFGDPSRDWIDLVTISHFDGDHVNGLLDLLAEYQIKTLMLPYVPLWQRLVIGFELKIGGRNPLMGFLLNPALFLRTRFPDKIGLIILVPPAGPQRPPSDRSVDLPARPPSLENSWAIEYTAAAPADEDEGADIGQDGKTVILQQGGRISVAGYWEFVPYNDASVAHLGADAQPLPDFQAAVAEIRDDLLKDPSQKTLTALKLIYTKQFGDDDEQKNLISLFQYCGPLGGTPISHVCDARFDWRWACRYFFHHRAESVFSKGAVLYTGDGYLNTAARLKDLCTYLGRSRIGQISCLQVMHHGSRSNWHAGVSTTIKPELSVFSSDPHHKAYLHPHQEVLRDFWSFNAVQVNKTHGVAIFGEVTV